MKLGIAFILGMVAGGCTAQGFTALDGATVANRVMTLERCDGVAHTTRDACEADGGSQGYCGGEGYAAYLQCRSDGGR